MAVERDGRLRTLVGQIVGTAKRSGKDIPRRMAESFIRGYYDRVPYEDIRARAVSDLAGQALAFLAFARSRRPGRAKVRVYNPARDADGWSSDHSVIEVVNDDMPFLVDSVTAALNTRGLNVHIVVHPIISAWRDSSGTLKAVDPEKPPARLREIRESCIHVEVDRQATAEERADLERDLKSVLDDVRAAVTDWQPMRGKLGEIIEELSEVPAGIDREELDEVHAFLRWIDDNHFTFLGYRRFAFDGAGGAKIRPVRGSSLGILRNPRVHIFHTEGSEVPPDTRVLMTDRAVVNISKANQRATVHRPVHMDTLGIKIMNRRGRAVGEHRFVGLFTSHAYSLSPRFIPLLRRKINRTVVRAGFDPTSHDGKALLHILENYPRDELFQIGEDDLLEIALGILHLQERQRTALFVRRDPFGRFLSCLVFTPRDVFGTALRERFGEILCRAFGGTVSAFYTQLGDEPLARIHFIIKVDPRHPPEYDHAAVERELVAAARSWSDELHDILIHAHGEQEGLALFRRYGKGFSPAYQAGFSASQAVLDLDKIEEVLAGDEPAFHLYRRQGASRESLRLKVYHRGAPLPLSDALPVLENLGLRVIAEVPYRVAPAGADPVWIHDFGLVRRHLPDKAEDGESFTRIKEMFEETFRRLWRGEVEDDGYNRLVLSEGLNWRQVVLVRAYSKYLRQTGAPFSQDYMIDTFARNPGFARLLTELFAAMFDPADRKRAESRAVTLRVRYEEALEAVASLDEDRILRRFLNLVLATLRTNAYQTGENGEPKPYLSFKLDSAAIDHLPLPRPWREIFVYSPRMEGVHLRGGPVARGGIRWSDRREDFRTEILGLMKAQMVKNAVIVPVGAKGGFVVKRPPAEGGREALQAEGIACYTTLMRGMLDVTDNRKGDRVIPPPDVIRHDDDDPYLVVAADKGTATFSDIANGIAQEYGFWLDDAFASGGSAGYDHKEMGITARGAWESVKRHFREMGTDIQTQDFTVVGIGDMGGDVFGNGMLLSRHIRLLAAFNHLHIFVDPDPDPEKSFRERRRLFRKKRSTWMDYDNRRISRGGGVFERSAKSISLSPEIKALIGTGQGAMAPEDLIRALLTAETDLMWFGGIGTFVKAAEESDAEVGDRANDGVRVNAEELRCKVIGEGANLGITQAGRVAFARAGGRLNTDSIDNSAGVDCSDHEVNIKILLGQVMAARRLTRPNRDKLLERMTDEVAALVLRDNYLQTGALSVSEAQAPERLGNAVRLIRALERSGRLNREIERLPDEETLQQIANSGCGLTRPELAVLLAHAKLALFEELCGSDLPDERLLLADLVAYFPKPVQEKYRKAIPRHRLGREIIATSITNQVVNRAGPTFVNDMKERSGRAAPAVARSFVVVRDAFAAPGLWDGIEALDNKVAADVQTRMLIVIKLLMERAVLWFLRNGAHPLDIETEVGRFRPGIGALGEALPDVISDADCDALRSRHAELREAGVPDRLAGRIASLPLMNAALDIIRVAGADGGRVADVARIYFDLGTRFGFDWLRGAAERLEVQTAWQRQAVQGMTDELYALQHRLVAHAVEVAGGVQAAEAVIEAWADARRPMVERTEQMLADMQAAGSVDIAMLAVAIRQLRALIAE